MNSPQSKAETLLPGLILEHAQRWESWGTATYRWATERMPSQSESRKDGMSAQQIQRAHEKAVQSRLPCTLIGHALGPQFHFTGPLRGFSDVIDRCRVERPELVDSLKETQETFLKSIAGLQQMAEDRSPSTQALLLAFLGADLPGLVFRLRRLADLSAAAKRLPDETLQTPPEGDWSVPTSLADLANRLDNVSLKKAKSILRPYGLKQSGNRQLWTVRLDGMPPNIRQKIERKKQ